MNATKAAIFNATIDALAKKHNLDRVKDYSKLFQLANEEISGQISLANTADENHVRAHARQARQDREATEAAEFMNEAEPCAMSASRHAADAERLANATANDPQSHIQAARAHKQAARAQLALIQKPGLAPDRVVKAYGDYHNHRTKQAEQRKFAGR